jgi:hypothetical protein
MSQKAALFLAMLLLAGFGALLFWAADPVSRWLSRPAEKWAKDGVVRGPGMMKIWQDRSPRNFSTFVGLYQGMAVFWWFALKGLGILIVAIAVGELVVGAVA